MNHRDRHILLKVIQEIDVALDMMGTIKFEDFQKNEMLKRAICMTVINIGELVKNITDETRAINKHIPWKAVAGFRDIAAHKYQTLKMEDVYQTVVMDFPELKVNIKTMLGKEERMT